MHYLFWKGLFSLNLLHETLFKLVANITLFSALELSMESQKQSMPFHKAYLMNSLTAESTLTWRALNHSNVA